MCYHVRAYSARVCVCVCVCVSAYANSDALITQSLQDKVVCWCGCTYTKQVRLEEVDKYIRVVRSNKLNQLKL